ncbi:hypothetical protein FGO68_gene12950 [Halteria grandinella]|uniref:Uncharacterized protein n=1 Tax=Halteria grandinella TaxID=5974 RepID=A0A8J8NSE9_HALGN|nr:hypothetical protein FGO68_gene12950 [Halteria grandinella]
MASKEMGYFKFLLIYAQTPQELQRGSTFQPNSKRKLGFISGGIEPSGQNQAKRFRPNPGAARIISVNTTGGRVFNNKGAVAKQKQQVGGGGKVPIQVKATGLEAQNGVKTDKEQLKQLTELYDKCEEDFQQKQEDNSRCCALMQQELKTIENNKAKLIEERAHISTEQEAERLQYQDLDRENIALHTELDRIQQDVKDLAETHEQLEQEITVESSFLEDLNGQIYELEEDVDDLSKSEKQFYEDVLLRQEFINYGAKKGPIVLGIQSQCSEIFTEANLFNKESYGWKMFDKLLSDNRNELDQCSSSSQYFAELVLKPILEQESFCIPQFKQATFLFFSPTLYKDTISNLAQSYTIFTQSLHSLSSTISLSHLKSTQAKISLMNLDFPQDEDPSSTKSFTVLIKLKAFLTSIMNDTEGYLIDKRIMGEPDENVRHLLRAISHKELIFIVIDFREHSFAKQLSECKELQVLVSLFRKIKFFNY